MAGTVQNPGRTQHSNVINLFDYQRALASRKPPSTHQQLPTAANFSEYVAQLFPHYPSPDFPKFTTFHKKIFDPADNDIARKYAERMKPLYAERKHAFFEHFLSWEKYVYQLIVASAAYAAGREQELASNYEGLYGEWMAGSLKSEKHATHIGLVEQLDVIHGALSTPLPDVALRSMALGSHILDHIAKRDRNDPSDQSESLAKAIFASARTCFSPTADFVSRCEATFAAQRSINALPENMRTKAVYSVIENLRLLIKTSCEDNDITVVIKALHNITHKVQAAGSDYQNHQLFGALGALAFASRNGQTSEIRTFALDVHRTLTDHMIFLGIAIP